MFLTNLYRFIENEIINETKMIVPSLFFFILL